jgi:hypothetical protein
MKHEIEDLKNNGEFNTIGCQYTRIRPLIPYFKLRLSRLDLLNEKIHRSIYASALRELAAVKSWQKSFRH